MRLEIIEAVIITELANFSISSWVKLRGSPLMLIEAITLPAQSNIVAPTEALAKRCSPRFDGISSVPGFLRSCNNYSFSVIVRGVWRANLTRSRYDTISSCSDRKSNAQLVELHSKLVLAAFFVLMLVPG